MNGLFESSAMDGTGDLGCVDERWLEGSEVADRREDQIAVGTGERSVPRREVSNDTICGMIL